MSDHSPDWGPTAIVLRQLAQTMDETPGDRLPKAAVVRTLNQVADRLLIGDAEGMMLRPTTDPDHPQE